MALGTARKTVATVVYVCCFLLVGFVAQGLATKDLVFVEDGVLYRSLKDKPGEKKSVSSNVAGILDHKHEANKLLYRVRTRDPEHTDNAPGYNLILVDTNKWVSQYVASDVLTAGLSPDGTTVVVWNSDQEIHLITSEGKPLKRVGKHGAVPIVSHDDKRVAYQKLADESIDGDWQSYFEDAYGISLHDIQTGEEVLVTDGGVDDFAPLGFSSDGTRLFFNSARPYRNEEPEIHIASLWVVDLTNGQVTRLTNTVEEEVMKGKMAPIVNQNALWTSNRRIIISSNGPAEGVWIFRLAEDASSVDAVKIGDGDSPQWLVPDESVIYRVVKQNKVEWKTVNVK